MAKETQSLVSHTPSPKPQRENMNTSQEVNSSFERSPALQRLTTQAENTPVLPCGEVPINSQADPHSQERRSALQRLTTHAGNTPVPSNALVPSNAHVDPQSHDRLSALQRLTPPAERVPLLRNGAANSDSGRLQEVEIQYLEVTFPPHLLSSAGQPSSSRIPAKERLSRNQESPIRTLSEDRRVVALNLDHPQTSEEGDPSYQLPTVTGRITNRGKETNSKATGKNIQTRKRVARSPLQGVSLKKQRLAKVHNSPRRKLVVEAGSTRDDTIGENPITDATTQRNPPIRIIPARSKKGADFRSGPSTLP